MTSYWELQTLAIDHHVRASLHAASSSIDVDVDSPLTTSLRRWLLGALQSFASLADGQAVLWDLAGDTVTRWLSETALLRDRVEDEDDRLWVAWLARAVVGALHEQGIDDPLLGEVALSAIIALHEAEPDDGDSAWWERASRDLPALTDAQTDIPAALTPPPGLPAGRLQDVYDRWILQAAQVLADAQLLPACPQNAGEWAASVMSRALCLLTADSREAAWDAWAECGAEAFRALSALTDRPMQDETRRMLANVDTASFSDPDQRLERLLHSLLAAAQLLDGVGRDDEWAYEELEQMASANLHPGALAEAAYAQLLEGVIAVCCMAIAEDLDDLPEVPVFDPAVTAGRMVAELRAVSGEELMPVAARIHQALAVFAARQQGHAEAQAWCDHAIADALAELGETAMADSEVLSLMLCDAAQAGLHAMYADDDTAAERFGELMPLIVDMATDLSALEDIDPVSVPALAPEIAAWLQDLPDTAC